MVDKVRRVPEGDSVERLSSGSHGNADESDECKGYGNDGELDVLSMECGGQLPTSMEANDHHVRSLVLGVALSRECQLCVIKRTGSTRGGTP